MTDIIDACARLELHEGRISADHLLASMDSVGIRHAVVAPPDVFVAVSNEEGNREIARIVERNPSRISGLAVANPWWGERACSLLRDAFESGLVGLYLNPGRQGFLLTESILNPLIDICLRYERPIYISTGTPVFAMPFQLAELARRFPEARFVMGHSAWTDFWNDVVPAARLAPNILVDTSCTFDAWIASAIGVLGPSRILFCSGYPRSRQLIEVQKIQRIGLAEEAERSIFRENALALWRLGI